MTRTLKIAVIASAFAAIPTQAGITETALCVCTISALQAAPGATVTTRKINEGGRATKISLWVKADAKRQFDCLVTAKGEVVSALADQAKETAVAATH